MAETEKTAYLGDGSLNALVIQQGTRSELGSVIKRSAENTGSLPGSAEAELNVAQNRIASGLVRSAQIAGQRACALSRYSKADIRRYGDAQQAMQIRFTCGQTPEDCCMKGLEAAVSSIQDEAAAAQAAVNEDPFAKFSS